MKQSLKGKVVLITGAARGIGAETARVTASRGARLALLGMEPERLEALCKELGDGHFWAECDVTDQRKLDGAVKAAVSRLGGIDVVVANAGISSGGTVSVVDVEALTRVIEVNLNGVIRTVCSTLPYITERRGYYLLVSSTTALRALPGLSTYSASKSGVEQFGNALRLELAHKGVTVGVVHPGWIDTDLVRDAKDTFQAFREMIKKLPGPTGKFCTVQACAKAYADAIEKRQKKVFFPRSLAFFSAIRPIFNGPLVDFVVAHQAKKLVPDFEREVQAYGSAFGEHSVAFGASGASGQAAEKPQQSVAR
ncbi:MAG: SDR family oxidoreductase [Polyangiaceae bacterium]|nr:SDR family oxidoreductase [Polyangiaceae bacterium]